MAEITAVQRDLSMRMMSTNYYVKAVPKAAVATSERSIKKINGEPAREEKDATDNVVS